MAEPPDSPLSDGARCELAHLVRMGRAVCVGRYEDPTTYAEQKELVAAGLARVEERHGGGWRLLPTAKGRREMEVLATRSWFLAMLAGATTHVTLSTDGQADG
jgi:hypothetical protein